MTVDEVPPFQPAVAAALLLAPEWTEAALSQRCRMPPTLMLPFWKLGVAPVPRLATQVGKSLGEQTQSGSSASASVGLEDLAFGGTWARFQPSLSTGQCLDAGHVLG